MARAVINSLLVTLTSENIYTEKPKDSVSTPGQMEITTPVSSSMDKRTAMACGRNQVLMIAISTKAATELTRRMDTANLNGVVALLTRVTTLLIRREVMVKCIGLMAPFIKVTGTKACSME